MAQRLKSTVYLALVASVLLGGCGQTEDHRPPTYPVAGTVVHNGQPVEGALVRFELVDASYSAAGKTDAQGQYRLTTFGVNDGAPAGQYKVSILKYETPPNIPTSESEKDYVSSETVDRTLEEVIPKNLLPAKYANVNTSGLTATVSEDGANRFDFTLSSGK